VSLGRAGLIASAVSVAATFAVAVLGPSVMEPALPGAAGQPPWAFAAHPPAGLAVGLTALALAAGVLGLGLSLHALHRGWTARPRPVLLAGILAATALALVPPFGSADHLSYAAYGRMVVTGHDPYTTTPAMLARLGDPVARAVQDWRGSPSVYGILASGLQALASAAGGTSLRLTVFVLSLLNVMAFAATGLLLHRLTRGSQAGQLRAALLWTCNPVLLQVLVAGAHVDSQAIVFAVAAITVFCLGLRGAAVRAGPVRAGPAWAGSWWQFAVCAGAGALAGLGTAVKMTMVLVLAGLLAATVLAAGRFLAVRVGGLLAGFVVIAMLALVPGGPGSLRPAWRAGSMVSIGSPWRTVRLLIRLCAGEGIADDVVKAAAALLAAVLVVLLVNALAPGTPGPGGWRPGGWRRRVDVAPVSLEQPDFRTHAAGPAGLALVCVFGFLFGWLMAWPYVLPWYDGLGWALLALLPLPTLGRPTLVRPAVQGAAGQGAPAGGAAPGAAALGKVTGAVVLWRGRAVGLVVALDWLMLAHTTALGFGYLPARGISMPPDLAWLRPVFRNAVTPLTLLTILVILLLLILRRPRGVEDTEAALSDTRATG
jgi:hypothetical protein